MSLDSQSINLTKLIVNGIDRIDRKLILLRDVITEHGPKCIIVYKDPYWQSETYLDIALTVDFF